MFNACVEKKWDVGLKTVPFHDGMNLRKWVEPRAIWTSKLNHIVPKQTSYYYQVTTYDILPSCSR